MRLKLLFASGIVGVALVVSSVGAPVAGAASLRVCPTKGPACPFDHIQDAINAAVSGSVISIAPGTYHENLVVDKTKASPLTLVGEGGPSNVTIDGSQKDSVLFVTGTATANPTVNLVGVTLTHGLATNKNGGGIDNVGGSVSVTRGRIIDNTATSTLGPADLPAEGFGGGVFNTDAPSPTSFPPTPPFPTGAPGAGTLSIVATEVSGNHADNGGAGISTISFNGATHATLVGTTIEDNHTIKSGGGGINNCGTLNMTSSPIRNNSALQGAGLANCAGPPAGTARLVGSPITGNHAIGTVVPPNGPPGVPAGHGGGVSNGGDLTLIASPVSDNTATGPGGGIFNAPGATISLIASPVTNNAAGGPGGGIFNVPGSAGPPPTPGGVVHRTASPVSGNTGNPPSTAQCGPTPNSC